MRAVPSSERWPGPYGITLKQAATADRIARGHPWVWREAIARGLDGAAAGEEVQLLAPDGAPAGRGLADPSSPIAVRVWTRKREPVDASLWRARAARACERRARLFRGTHTSAFRVLHGEGDRMPGLVVDRYGPVAVARADGEAAAAKTAELAEAIWPSLQVWDVRTLVLRVGAKGQAPRHELLRGVEPPESLQVEEHGVPFVVDLRRGPEDWSIPRPARQSATRGGDGAREARAESVLVCRRFLAPCRARRSDPHHQRRYRCPRRMRLPRPASASRASSRAIHGVRDR